jgi:tyrosyl-tRNA synthetase
MQKIITDEKRIDEILDRGTVVEVLPTKDEFKKKLLSGERLRFYIGFDATAATLHLSHAKNFMLLEKFRKLGHEVIVLFGDFTARIGDPTGESSARKQLTREDVKANVERWKELIKPLMNFEDTENPPLIKYNHDWLSKLNFEDIIGLASNFTVQQMLERDMFQKRMKEEKPIHLHEFLYPLMQGYDSVAMDVDVEMCGTDQIFNALTGRTLLKKLKNKEKFVVSVTLMEDPKTGELMSKSKGTGVFLNVSASDMYGQIMAQTDQMIEILFVNCTDLSFEEIKSLEIQANPRDAKMRLGFEITKIFHGKDEAQKAQDHFVRTIQNKEVPEDIQEIQVEAGKRLLEFLVEQNMAESSGDAKRKMKQGGVRINDVAIDDLQKELSPQDNEKILKVGKRDFRKLLVK